MQYQAQLRKLVHIIFVICTFVSCSFAVTFNGDTNYWGCGAASIETIPSGLSTQNFLKIYNFQIGATQTRYTMQTTPQPVKLET